MEASNQNLVTINSFAKSEDCTTAYIYKLIDKGDIEAVEIDGVKFIDKSKYSDVKKG